MAYAAIAIRRSVFEPGERLLAWVQVGTIGRQVERLGTGRPARTPYGRVLYRCSAPAIAAAST